MSTIDITGLDKAEVLAALYNASGPLGMGYLQFTPGDMPLEEARYLLKEHTGFDYLRGRVMKVRLDKDELFVGLYDRDNGQGAAAQALAPLFEKAAVDVDS